MASLDLDVLNQVALGDYNAGAMSKYYLGNLKYQKFSMEHFWDISFFLSSFSL